MPIAPRYERPVVQETAEPNLQRTVGSNPAALGGIVNPIDLSPVAQVASRIWEEEANKANQIAGEKARSKLSDAFIRLQVEASEKKGEAAQALPEYVAKEWKKEVEAIESELSNETQLSSFRVRAASDWNSLNQFLQRHVASERQEFDRIETESSIGKRKDLIAINYENPEFVEQNIGEMKAAFTDYANRRYDGKPPRDWLDLGLKELESEALTTVISRYLQSERDLDAKRIFEDNKDRLTGADAARIGSAVETGSLLGESQRRADEIMDQPDVTRSKAFETTKEIKDPKLRQATEQRLEVLFAQRQRAEAEEYNRLIVQAEDAVSQGRFPTATIWAQLRPKDQRALRNYLEEQSAGQPVKTDYQVYYDLKSSAFSSDPAIQSKFANTNLFQYRDRLSDSHFKAMLDRQIEIRNGVESPEAQGYMTVESMVTNTLNLLGMDPKDSDTKSRIANFKLSIDQAIANEKIVKGKKTLSNGEIRQIIDDNLMRDVLVRRRIWSDTSAAPGLLTDDEARRSYVPISKIPQNEVNKMREAMTERGVRITDDRISRAYAAMLRGDYKRANALLSGEE